MASGENVLWIVDTTLPVSNDKLVKSKVFRTREAAKIYAYDRGMKSPKHRFIVRRATWGPEQ